jgi:hypothetical protein
MYLAEGNLAAKTSSRQSRSCKICSSAIRTTAAALNNLAWAYQQEKDPRALETAEQAFKAGRRQSGRDGYAGLDAGRTGQYGARPADAAKSQRHGARMRRKSAITWQSACINRATNRARARNSTNCLQKTSHSLKLEEARALLKSI